MTPLVVLVVQALRTRRDLGSAELVAASQRALATLATEEVRRDAIGDLLILASCLRLERQRPHEAEQVCALALVLAAELEAPGSLTQASFDPARVRAFLGERRKTEAPPAAPAAGQRWWTVR